MTKETMNTYEDAVLYDGMWGHEYVPNPHAGEPPATLVDAFPCVGTDEWVKESQKHRKDAPAKDAPAKDDQAN